MMPCTFPFSHPCKRGIPALGDLIQDEFHRSQRTASNAHTRVRQITPLQPDGPLSRKVITTDVNLSGWSRINEGQNVRGPLSRWFVEGLPWCTLPRFCSPKVVCMHTQLQEQLHPQPISAMFLFRNFVLWRVGPRHLPLFVDTCWKPLLCFKGARKFKVLIWNRRVWQNGSRHVQQQDIQETLEKMYVYDIITVLSLL